MPITRRTCAIRSWRRSRCSRRRTPRTNLPAQIDIYAEGEDAYKFLFVAKGGGSANKTFLYPGDALRMLTHDRMMKFLHEKILTLGTSACPPYHLSIVIGGTLGRAGAEDRQARLRPAISTPCRQQGSESWPMPSAISRWRPKSTS